MAQKDTSITSWDVSCVLVDVAEHVQLIFVGDNSKVAASFKLKMDEFLKCSSPILSRAKAEPQDLRDYNSDSYLSMTVSSGQALCTLGLFLIKTDPFTAKDI